MANVALLPHPQVTADARTPPPVILTLASVKASCSTAPFLPAGLMGPCILISGRE